MKRYAKTTLCIVLSAAMLFTSTGMTVLAEENVQAVETQQEIQAEETSTDMVPKEEEITEEAPISEETSEQVSKEKDSGEEAEESTVIEKNSDNNVTSREQTNSEDVLVEEFSTDLEEAEVSENELKLTFSDTDIAHGEYKEDGNNITWVIDADGKLTVEGTGDFADPACYDELKRVPWIDMCLEIKTAEINVKGMTNASCMFSDCSNLTSLDLRGFDTCQVTNMDGMFGHCSALTNIDLSSFDTCQVINMEYMFGECSSLTSLDLRGFDTCQVSNMSGMFADCNSLTSLDLSSFDTSQVTNMSYMFGGCLSLTSLDLSSFDTSQVTNMGWIFYDCSALTNLDLRGFDTSQVTDMRNMFANCGNLTELDLRGFDTSQVTDMGNMFANCGNLTELDLRGFDTSKVTDMHSMFEWCNLTDLDLSSFDTSKVTDMGYTFYACSNLTDLDLRGFDTSKVTNMGYMFCICSNLTDLDLSSFDVSKVTDAEHMFDDCDNLLKIYTPCNLKTSVPLPSGDWYDMSEKTYTELPKELLYSILLAKGAKPTTYAERIAAIKQKTSYNVGDTVNTDDLTVRYYGSDGTVIILDAKDYTVSKVDTSTVGVKTLTVTYKSFTAEIKLIVEKKEESGGTEESSSAESSSTAESSKTEESSSVDGSSSDTDIAHGVNNRNGNDTIWVIDANGKLTVEGTGDVIFYDEEEDIAVVPWGDIAECITSAEINVTGAKIATYMFLGCSNLTSVDLSNFDTSMVTDMTYMFSGCSSLTDLNLSKFDTRNVTSMCSMFEGCSSLTSLDLSSFDTSNVTGGFQSTGGMNFMFYGCSSLTSLDLSSFDTSNVEGMGRMFYGCSNLTNLDLNGFKIGNLMDMDCMFSGCKSLTSIKLRSINKSNRPNSYRHFCVGMFAGCSSLECLDLSDFSPCVAYYNDIFSLSDCTALYRIYTPYNLERWKIDLPDNGWHDSQGNQYTSLPLNLSHSILLTKGNKEEGGDTEESSTEDKDDSPYEDSERTDLKPIGTIADIKAKVYDGNVYEPIVKVTVTIDRKRITLTEGADYRVLYKNNVNAGTGTVIIRGNGEYKGEITKDFAISQKPVKKLKVLTGSISGAGSLQTCPVYVYDGTKLLQSGKDYTLSDYKTVKANSAQVTVKAVESGNYTGSVVAKLAVYEEGVKIISPENVKLKETAVAYTGKAVKPEVTVTVDGTALTNKDYKVQYQNNKDAGTAYVIVTGKGAYKGKAVVPFTIKAETIDKPNDFTIKNIKAAAYNGKLQKPAVSVSIQKNGKAKKLSKKDYTVTYKNNLHAGEATVIVTGKGNYAGLSAATKFTINPQQIKKASLKGTQGNLVLMYSKRKLKEGTDYEKPEYGAANKNKVSVTIKGKGDFTGEMTKTVKVQ